MNVNLLILKLFLKREIHSKYGVYVKEFFLENPELERILLAMDGYYGSSDQDIDTVENLELIFRNAYPAMRPKDYDAYSLLFDNMREATAESSLVEEYLGTLRQKALALKVAQKAIEVGEGRALPSEVVEAASALAEQSSAVVPADEEKFVSSSLEAIWTKQIKERGLRWRLNCLNQSLGSLRKGDFGFVFARPETGKTTFLADQATYMAGQMDKPVLWFNNEEQGEKVMLRCFQSALGWSNEQLFRDIPAAQEAFSKVTNSGIKLYDSAKIHRKDIERICAEVQPGLIIFDQIDKITGFSDDRRDLELGAIYQFARELAKQYAPVIGVCQAGGEGEGVMWLDMGHVADSKTSKQAEADFIVGIGKVHATGKENLRFLNISKNKLVGDDDSIPALRHGHLTAIIRPEIGRYEDVA